jgi:flagellar basal body-associated protein FliL
LPGCRQEWDVDGDRRSPVIFIFAREEKRMVKYIVGLVLAVVVTVAVAVAVAIPVAKQNAAAAAAAPVKREAGYMFSLTDHDKTQYLTTTLADGKVARLQLILELDPTLAPKDQKNPDRKMLVLQDTLLRTLREMKSSDLAAGNQEVFKQRIADAATKVLGKRAVLGVYLTGATMQVGSLPHDAMLWQLRG